MDDHGHGTHVAGTIGAAGNNGVGVTGVNWTTRMVAVKMMDSTVCGSVSSAISGIDFLIALKTKFAQTATPVDVRVISASWDLDGFSQGCSMRSIARTPTTSFSSQRRAIKAPTLIARRTILPDTTRRT